jgi:hypothetical protein
MSSNFFGQQKIKQQHVQHETKHLWKSESLSFVPGENKQNEREKKKQQLFT